MSNYANAFTSTSGDLLCCKTLAIDQLDGPSLTRLQTTEDLFDKDAIFDRETTEFGCTRLASFHQRVVKRVRHKELIRYLGASTVERPLISKHQEPALESAFFRIELTNGAKDIQEDLLDHVFGFRVVPQYPSGNPEQQRGMSLEENCECVGVPTLKLLCEFLIGGEPLTHKTDKRRLR